MAGISKKKIKTKSGKEVIKYTITYRDVFGKQHTSGLYDTIKEAKKDLGKFDEVKTDDKKISVRYILNGFIESRKEKERAYNTIRNYEHSMKYHLKNYLDIPYQKISTLEWQKILYKIRDNYSVFAANGCYKLLRAAFRWALKFSLISTNPIENVEPIELPEVEHNHFEIEELLNLLKVCKNNFDKKYYALLFTFIVSGMREGEIFGLLKENIDFENHRIKVCTQYTAGEFKEKTKTKKSKRFVYMFPTFEEILKEHIKEDKTDSTFVFHNSKGKPLNQSNVRNRFWIKLLEYAGYPPDYARIHDLRGSNADIAIVLGLSITYAAENLGHSSESTTLKHYARSNRAMISEGMKKFEETFNLKKCEKNVRINTKPESSNIIYFSKHRQDKA